MTKLSMNCKLCITVKSWDKSTATSVSLCLLEYARWMHLSAKLCHFHTSTSLIFASSTLELYDVSIHYMTIRKILYKHEYVGYSITEALRRHFSPLVYWVSYYRVLISPLTSRGSLYCVLLSPLMFFLVSSLLCLVLLHFLWWKCRCYRIIVFRLSHYFHALSHPLLSYFLRKNAF